MVEGVFCPQWLHQSGVDYDRQRQWLIQLVRSELLPDPWLLVLIVGHWIAGRRWWNLRQRPAPGERPGASLERQISAIEAQDHAPGARAQGDVGPAAVAMLKDAGLLHDAIGTVLNSHGSGRGPPRAAGCYRRLGHSNSPLMSQEWCIPLFAEGTTCPWRRCRGPTGRNYLRSYRQLGARSSPNTNTSPPSPTSIRDGGGGSRPDQPRHAARAVAFRSAV